MPNTTDEEGMEVEPNFVSADDASLYEVHHGDWDRKNSVAGNLFVLWKKHHRSLRNERARA